MASTARRALRRVRRGISDIADFVTPDGLDDVAGAVGRSVLSTTTPVSEAVRAARDYLGDTGGAVGRTVFWPAPHVDSGLVAFTRREPPVGDRAAVFAVVDAAFAQRRKTLRAALAGWAGSAPAAEVRLRAAGIDPGARGEQLDVTAFARLAATDAHVG